MINLLNRLQRSTHIILGLVIVACVAMLDYVTGVRLSFSIFYFLPIILVSWFVNRQLGLFFAILSALAWGTADYLGHAEHVIDFEFLFNTGVRLGIFLMIAWLIARLRSDSEELMNERLKKQTLQENFVSLVKHELRNTVSTGKLMLNLLSQEALTKEQLKLIQSIDVENDRVQETIDTLSLLERTNKSVKENFVLIPLNQVVETVLRRLNKREKVEVLNETVGTFSITSSPSAVEHVIENVISNAIKYTLPGGTVRIQLCQEGFHVCLLCKDTGIGIPEDEQRYLFDPFFRASNASRENGTGIGLFVTKELLQKIGGTITLHSHVGEGTEVMVCFPTQ